MIELGIVLSLLTGIGIAAITRGSGVAAIYTLRQMRAVFVKRSLKKMLNKSIKKCSYNDFHKTIYDIKNFDIQYEKSFFNEIKTKYNLTEEQINSRSYFNERFNKDNKQNNIDDILDYIDKKYETFKI